MARFRRQSFRIRPVDLVFALGSLVATRALLWRGREPLGPFDEGLLFANAQLMGDGAVPYRDFYSNYPPGIFQIVRAAIAFTAAPIWTMRWISFGVHVATAACCAMLVGRARKQAFCAATCMFVLVLQADVGLVPYAYTFAVLLVLIVLLCWPLSAAARARTVGCGVMLGVLTYLRHDVFIYLMLPLFACEAVWWMLYRSSFFFSELRQLLLFVAGAALTALCLWLPVFVRAGFSRVAHDLYLDQVGAVMAARVLPVPPMFTMTEVPSLSLQLPSILAEPTRFGLALIAISVPAAAFVAGRGLMRGRWTPRRTRLAVLCLASAVATLPQAFGRTDYWHVAFVLPLVAVAGFRALGPSATEVISLLSLLVLLAQSRSLISAKDLKELWQATDDFFVTADRRSLADLIDKQTAPGEPVFIGCRSHRRPMMSVLDLHYLAHRPGATRYMQFDPGLVGTAEKQREMIADLERTKPRLMLQFVHCLWDEPNASMSWGATELDDYLQSTFVRERNVGAFDIWHRK